MRQAASAHIRRRGGTRPRQRAWTKATHSLPGLVPACDVRDLYVYLAPGRRPTPYRLRELFQTSAHVSIACLRQNRCGQARTLSTLPAVEILPAV